jgi:hypothetical protein
MEIRPVGAKLFRADGRTDMTKLMAFRKFAKSALNQFLSSVLLLAYSQNVGKEAGSTGKSL